METIRLSFLFSLPVMIFVFLLSLTPSGASFFIKESACKPCNECGDMESGSNNRH